ncbi:uncharacterized protein LOC123515736 [Portunus trituberculatus]|uniref:uncharacterized protein LOC123515736 n=1 Tax=Portunus trituberculatus TaxID=210409 RepID=UPI001E1CF9A2|nr:uncharacterized protein LOC123515736 [Portunus trituberculatus]
MFRSFRLSTAASSWWCVLPISRSRSLTTLPDEINDDLLIPNTPQYSRLLSKASTSLSASSNNLTDSNIISNQSRKHNVNKGRTTQRHRQSCRSPSREVSQVTCGSSLCAKLDSTLTQNYEPYETPHYYTFHLTLRSPSNGLPRGKSLTHNRCGRNYRSSCNSESDQSKTHRCSGLGMNIPGNTGSVISAERDANKVKTENKINVGDGTRNDDGMPSDDTKSPATNQSFRTETTQDTDGKEAPGHDQKLKLRHPSDEVKCICFGIVDYLNTVFKEVDQDAFWESWCGNYGPVLTSAPPTGISDSESDIEPLAVSLSFPLNYSGGTGYEGGGTPMRSKQCLKLIRWKSCHELLSHRRPKTLKRQLTDCSFHGRFSAGMVEVYDGNLGISVVPVSIGNCSIISPNLRTNIIPRNFSVEKGRVCFKGPASSPPSLVHSTNGKQCVEHSGKKMMFLSDKLVVDGSRRLLGVVKTAHGTNEGIHPFDTGVFQEEDFGGAFVTDRPLPNHPTPSTSATSQGASGQPDLPPPTQQHPNSTVHTPQLDQPSRVQTQVSDPQQSQQTSATSDLNRDKESAIIGLPSGETATDECSLQAKPISNPGHQLQVSPRDIRPLPKAAPRKGTVKVKKAGAPENTKGTPEDHSSDEDTLETEHLLAEELNKSSDFSEEEIDTPEVDFIDKFPEKGDFVVVGIDPIKGLFNVIFVIKEI